MWCSLQQQQQRKKNNYGRNYLFHRVYSVFHSIRVYVQTFWKPPCKSGWSEHSSTLNSVCKQNTSTHYGSCFFLSFVTPVNWNCVCFASLYWPIEKCRKTKHRLLLLNYFCDSCLRKQLKRFNEFQLFTNIAVCSAIIILFRFYNAVHASK